MKREILLSLFLMLLSSCATVNHVPVNSDEEDLISTGIRYYESSPYLLIYSNGKGSIVTKILYLPDPNKKMSATPDSFVAQLKTSMNFKNGVLTNVSDTADATVFPKAVLEVAKTIAPLLLAANQPDGKTLNVPAPYLYKIIVNGNQLKFIGGQGDQPYNITLLPKIKKEEKKGGE